MTERASQAGSLVSSRTDPSAATVFACQKERGIKDACKPLPQERASRCATRGSWAQAALGAPEKTYKAVTINRRTSTGNSEPKSYLHSHNTNEEGQLICQLCNDPMPFKLPNGEEYFEAYQYINLLEKEYDANHLALCSNCAAEFQYACQTDESKRAELILGINMMEEEENLVVYLDMPVHRRLRFTQRHFIDLQTAIRDWLETDSSMELHSRDGGSGRCEEKKERMGSWVAIH